ncbi:MAG: ABC transporter ATP-binding protein [Wenzhouxiangellaceae bacterium]|nr:ABC transporter ATP-binding protein [Wenzhouxiangellaceae bacterium]
MQCRGLSVSIGQVRVVEQLDLDLAAGQSWGVLGPNGAGKTTLLLTLAGVRSADSGRIMLDGQELTAMPRRSIARRLGMLVQNTRFAFEATCLEVALSGRHPHLGAWSRESPADIEIARQALCRTGLEGMQDRSCTALSGGEQRRLALALVLAQNPAVMLLDEPTNHLDPAHQVEMLDQLWQRVHRPGYAQIMALHDMNLATCYCSHVLMLFGQGRWESGPAATMLTEDRLSELFDCPIRAVSDHRQTVFAAAGGRPVDSRSKD